MSKLLPTLFFILMLSVIAIAEASDDGLVEKPGNGTVEMGESLSKKGSWEFSLITTLAVIAIIVIVGYSVLYIYVNYFME